MGVESENNPSTVLCLLDRHLVVVKILRDSKRVKIREACVLRNDVDEYPNAMSEENEFHGGHRSSAIL